MDIRRHVLCISFLLTFPSLAFSEVIPDFYAEPGISQFREGVNTSLNESIDPLSGTLHFVHTDGTVPGNGGLDISIVRSYTSLQGPAGVGPRTVTGIGWTNHFGRVLSKNINGCTGDPSTMNDNPVLELQDGSRFIVAGYNNDIEGVTNISGISKERWNGGCVVDAQGNFDANRYRAYSPDGLRYDMDEWSFENGEKIWHVTRITDSNGNWINISYKEVGGSSVKYKVIDLITSSDNRSVQYSYLDENTENVLLGGISSHGQNWAFSYISAGIANYYYLSEVTRPDGQSWQYDYYKTASGLSTELYSMKSVVYPRGAKNTYTYQSVVFDALTGTPVTSVKDKVVSNAGPSNGTWSYLFSPSDLFDTTTVTTPNGQLIYKHYGIRGVPANMLWRVGMLKEKQTIDNSLGLLRKEIYEWGSQYISPEKYTRPTLLDDVTLIDNAYYAPVMIKNTVIQDGSTYTTEYLNHDAFGNPGTIIETGDDIKRTDLTYFYNFDKWIVNRVQSETIEGIGSIFRNYDLDTGNLLAESKYGVVTSYTYHPTGDVNTSTNARGYTTTYDNYKRGIAQLTVMPEGVSTSQVINDRGTVASKTNGRGYTTNFTYDTMNRLTSIDYPINTDVSIVYSGLSSATLTRGIFQMVTKYDGLGQTISTEQKDTLRGLSIIQSTEYNALGQVTLKSYPYYGPKVANPAGTVTKYDILDRPVAITHPDTTKVKYDYLTGNRVKVTNERLFQTTYSYRSYGEPNEKSLIKIESPEAIITTIEKNKLDQITKVTQGTYKRDYTYDSRYYLISRNDPEIGLTEFGRDALGNMISRTVAGKLAASYSYDKLDRLRLTSFPYAGVLFGTEIRFTTSINRAYDKNSNLVKIRNLDRIYFATDFDNSAVYTATRDYSYNINDDLVNEKLTLTTNRNGRFNSKEHLTEYLYTNLGFLSYIKYPKGTTVSYNPDAFGRATSAQPFITDVSYHPTGMASQIVFRNGQVSQTSLDIRQRPTRYQTFGNSNDVDLTYTYDDMGNVTGITDGLEPQYARTLSYDGIDRLKTASGQWGAGSIAYDPVGNITSKSIGNESLSYNYDATNKLLSVTGNKSFNYSYDSRGNVRSRGGRSYYYDLSDRIRMVGNNITYDYDGNGLRVRKTVEDAVGRSDVTEYFYANNGNLLGDYSQDGLTFVEYVYLGSQLVAMRDVSLIPPTANAGSEQGAFEGETVSLNAASSKDTDGVINEYSWTQLSGPTVTLVNAFTATPSFVAPNVTSDTEVILQLMVTDDDAQTGIDTVTIKIYDTSPPAVISDIVLKQGVSDITIAWGATAKADSYNIYWSTSPELTLATGNKIENVATPYVHANLTSGNTYYYIVTGVNAYGESPESVIKNIAPNINGVSTLENISFEAGYGIEQVVDNPDGTKSLYYRKSGSTSIRRIDYNPVTGWGESTVDEEFVGSLNGIVFDKLGNALSVVQRNDKIVAKFKQYGQPWGAEMLVHTTDETVKNLRGVISLDGTAHIIWDEFCCNGFGTYGIKTSTYHPVDDAWTTPITHDRYGKWNISTGLVTDNNGNALLTLREELNDTLSYRRYDAVLKSWGEKTTLSGIAGFYGVTISDSGYTVIHYASTNIADQVRAIAFAPGFISTSVENSAFIADPDFRFLPRFYINNTGYGAAIWQTSDGKILARRFDPVLGWENETGFIGFGTLSLRTQLSQSDVTIDDAGNVSISWIYDTPSPSSIRSIMFNRFQVGKGWGNQIRVSQFDNRSNSFYTTINVSLLENEKALITWSQINSDGVNRGLYSSVYSSFGVNAAQQNSAPLAVTAADFKAVEQTTAVLDALSSFDIDGSIVSYEWTQIAGAAVTLNGANTSTPTFTAPLVNSVDYLQFQVKVTDDNGDVDFASQKVTVVDLPSPELVTILSAETGNILSWSEQDGADSYNLYWATTADVTPTTGTLIENVTSPYVHTELTAAQDYYYAVVSVNADGESKLVTEYKATWKDVWQSPFEVDATNYSTQPYHLSSNSAGESTLTWGQSTSVSGVSDIYTSLFSPLIGWSTPEKINSQQALNNRPVSVTNADGSRVVAWERTDGGISSLHSSTYVNGIGWTPAVTIGSSSNGLTLNGYDIKSDGVGNVIAVWENGANIYTNRYITSSGWGAAALLGNGTNPYISITQDGQAIVSWSSDNVGGVIGSRNLWAARYAVDVGWTPAEKIRSGVEGLIDGPIVSIDDTGSVLLIWNETSINGFTSINSLQYFAATGWSDPYIVDFDDANTTNLQLSGNDVGQQFVSWLRQESNGKKTLFVRRFDKTVGWDDIELIDVSSGNIEAANIHINSVGDAALIWRKADLVMPSNKSMHASVYDGNSWSLPTSISDSYQSTSSLTLPVIKRSDSGDALSVWNQKASANMMNHYRKTAGLPSNARPNADAGVDQTVNINEAAILNGSNSLDTDGIIENYVWTQLTGPSMVLDVTNPVAPTFTTPSVIADVDAVFQLNVTDNNGDIHTDSVTVTITNPLFNNKVKPVVTAPADITVEATALTTPISSGVLGVASALDDIEGALTATSDAPGSFPLGVNTVTWSATDTAGNIGTATQLVTIVDTTSPTVTAPADVGVQSDTPVSVTIGTATATDIFTPVNLSNDAPSLFPVGITTVTWTATDTNGNSGTATQTITVTATPVVNSPPVINGINAAFVGSQIQLIADVSDVDNGPSPLSYQWSIESGGGSLTTTTEATTYYNLPSSNVTVTFKLIVSDGKDSAQTNYTLTIGSGSGSSNQAPYATAFNAYYIAADQIQLVISATDPDGGPSPLSYQWTIVSGGGSLSNATTANPVYTTTNLSPGTYTIYFKVEISDGEATSPYTLPLTITIN